MNEYPFHMFQPFNRFAQFKSSSMPPAASWIRTYVLRLDSKNEQETDGSTTFLLLGIPENVEMMAVTSLRWQFGPQV